MILTNGMIFGSCRNGGTSNNGTLYFMGTNGIPYQTIHNFGGTPFDGGSPNNITVAGGTIYGTTFSGSTNSASYGTIYKIGTNGNNYSILRVFTNLPDGSSPMSALVLAGTNLFGTATAGGTNGQGILFSIGTNGANYNIWHTFLTNGVDGLQPQGSLILLGTNLYGTTKYGGRNGGPNNGGTVFRICTNGSSYTIIHNFTNQATDGTVPVAALVAVTNVLYGTTSLGGSNNTGIIFGLTTNGTSYSILAQFSKFTTPASNNIGIYSYSPLTWSGNRLWGECYVGGANNFGTLFQLYTNGANFVVLKSFTNAPDGNYPHGALTVVSSNLLFGTTDFGGANNAGIAYMLSLTAPVISQQPQNVTVTNGYPSSFSAQAAGVGLLNYQWYFHTNAVITNATGTTYGITNTITNNIGTYNVIVTNSFGSVTSSYAKLSVISVPVLLDYGYNSTNGSFNLALAYSPTATNRIWASTNLMGTNLLMPTNFWHVIATNKMGTNGLWFFTDTNTAKTNHFRFYRYSTP